MEYFFSYFSFISIYISTNLTVSTYKYVRLRAPVILRLRYTVAAAIVPLDYLSTKLHIQYIYNTYTIYLEYLQNRKAFDIHTVQYNQIYIDTSIN